MKWTGIIILLLLFSACDNELRLNADWKDIPIVYGLISLTAENQFIRIEKAFLDPDSPPGEVALIADSLYYSNLEVKLNNITKGKVVELEKIDGNEEELEREDGAFATHPNTLYKVETELIDLDPGDEIMLEINRGENKDLVTATTKMIDSVLISRPSTRINFDYINNFSVQWFPKTSENAPLIYDVSFQIYFRELDLKDEDPEWETKSVLWQVAKNVEETVVQKTGKEFYIFLANHLSELSNLRREFLSMDVIIDSGGLEILDYTRVGQANLGITASQEIPFYSNLSEGRGIFSTRNRNIRKNILLSPISRDSLANGQFTNQLNFVD